MQLFQNYKSKVIKNTENPFWCFAFPAYYHTEVIHMLPQLLGPDKVKKFLISRLIPLFLITRQNKSTATFIRWFIHS